MRVGVFVRLFIGSSQRLCGNRLDQMAMLHAFERDQLAGKGLDRRRFSVHDQHFQAGVVVQMGVACGDNQIVMFML